VGKTLDFLKLNQTVTNDSIVRLSADDFKKHKAAIKAQDSILKVQGDGAGRLALSQTLKAQTASRKYFSNLPEDQKPAEGKSLKLISTELFQSVNPFWVVLLTPVVVGFWGFLRRRRCEPSTAAKIAIGLVITALSALVMVGAVKSTDI
jgi:POT family proton-dependent oligopeptide transporter